jgi:uncharacterized Fe-S center protein
MAAKVWTMDRRSLSADTGFVPQTGTLFDAAGFDKLIKPGDLVAVKIHCGEWNNTAYLRPVYARMVVDKIKELGARPFVTDTCTLTYSPYAGRSIAPDLVATAERNGFNSGTLGVPFIAADGFAGTDDIRVPLPEGYILQEAYIAKAIALADVMIVLTHFKGHPMGVIGGSIKNLGIGCQSKRGKYNVHMGRHPEYGFPNQVTFHPENVPEDFRDIIPYGCPHGAYSRSNGTAEWDPEKCDGCLGCMGTMLNSGAWEMNGENFRAFNAACADGALAVNKILDGKIGYLNLGLDVSPQCDCVGHADIPLTSHLGIYSSHDPVAIDKACLDKATELPGMLGSGAEDWGVHGPGNHKFAKASSLMPDEGVTEEIQLNTGVENGLGTMDYELIDVPGSGKPQEYGFSFDRRPVGERFARMYAKENPFPKDRHDGRGFDRKAKVDLEKVAGPLPVRK